jgi:hypothetical protein
MVLPFSGNAFSSQCTTSMFPGQDQTREQSVEMGS